jgi:predicted ATPase
MMCEVAQSKINEIRKGRSQRSEAELQDRLAHLIDAGLVFQRGTPPAASFLFKYALVQETAYSMLLRGPRQALHARIARALETGSPELIKTCTRSQGFE